MTHPLPRGGTDFMSLHRERLSAFHHRADGQTHQYAVRTREARGQGLSWLERKNDDGKIRNGMFRLKS